MTEKMDYKPFHLGETHSITTRGLFGLQPLLDADLTPPTTMEYAVLEDGRLYIVAKRDGSATSDGLVPKGEWEEL